MAKLYFKVGSDWEEVVRLRNEISKLKQELKGMDSTQSPAPFKTLNTQLAASSQRLDELVAGAAKAGAEMETGFKKKIFDASQSVNGFTEKIIAQKAVVKDTEADVKRLGEAYRIALKRNPMSANGKLSEYTSAKKALDEDKAALFELTQQQANARLSVKKLRDEYALYKDDAKGVADTNNGIAISWKKALAVIGGVTALKALGSEIIRVRGEFQSMQTAMETMVGKDVAGPLMAQVKELAKISPLTMTDMVGAEKMMLGFNIQAEDTIKYLKALSDISMGESGKFNSLTLAFSQMSAAGKLMGQDLNQMINAGFNPLQQMAETTGKSIATLKDEMSKGAISAEMVQQAFIDAASAGGKFYNMSENASKTINGQLSMMRDALDNVFNELGTKGEGIIISSIQATTSLIQNYETVGKVLVGLVTTYGVYRTAVMFAIEAEKGYTIAQTLNIKVLTLAEKAQKLLNKTMLSNPYVLAAVALGVAVTALITFRDTTTAAEKAQENYNKKVKDANDREQERKERLESLAAELQNECTAETRRMEILGIIKTQYPAFFKLMLDEKGHVRDLTEAWKAYNEEVAKNKAIQNKTNASDLKQSIDDMKRIQEVFNKYGYDFKSYTKNDLSLYQKYKPYETGNLKENIEKNERELWIWEKKVRDDEFTQWKVDLKSKTDAQIEASRAALVKRAQSANGDKNLLAALGKRIIAIDEEKNVRKANDVNYDEKFNTAKANWENAKKTLTEIEKDKKKFTEEQYINAKKLEETTEKAYKELGGDTNTSKQENQSAKQAEALRKEQEKLNLLMNKQALEQKRAEEDLQIQTDQSRINAMKEGSFKTLEQMKLDHQKEMQQLERQKEDLLLKRIEDEKALFDAEEDKKAAEDPKHVRQTFDGSKIALSQSEKDAYNDQEEYLRQKYQNENQAYIDEQRRSWDEYLSEYANFQERKQALERLYEDKVGKATTSGEKETLKKELESKQKDLNIEEIKSSINFADIFGNLDSQSTEAIKTLREKLKEIIEQSAKDLKPSDLKALQEAIQNMDLKISERDPFGELKNSISNYKSSCKEIEEAQKVYNATLEKGWTIVAKYDEATGKTTYAYVEQKNALKELTDAQKKRQESLTSLTQSVNAIGQNGKELVEAGNNVTDMLSSLGVEIPEAVSGTLDGLGQVMDSLANVDFNNPFSIVKGITGALAGIGKTIGSWFGINNKVISEETFAEYDRLVDAIDELLDKQNELVKNSDSVSAEIAANEAKLLAERKKQAAQNLNLEYLSSYDGSKHTVGYNLAKDLSGYRSAIENAGINWNDLFGTGRMEGLADLDADQIRLLQGLPEVWAKLPEKVRDFLNDVVEAAESANEVTESMKENLTGVSFDGFKNSFLDTLKDMDSSSKDFADNLEDYIKNAMLQSLLDEVYAADIKKLYEKFAAYRSKDSEGGSKITDAELEELRKEQKELAERILADRNGLADIYGWESSTSQSSTKGGFETMSQDTGNELNGRFTALQMAGEEIKSQNTLQSQSLNLLTMKADDIFRVNSEIRNIADDTRDLIANSYLELVQISENTGAIVKPIQQMQKDMAEVKKNTAGLAT